MRWAQYLIHIVQYLNFFTTHPKNASPKVPQVHQSYIQIKKVRHLFGLFC